MKAFLDAKRLAEQSTHLRKTRLMRHCFHDFELAENAVATHARIPVLSLWKRLPFIPLFAAHLHLRWPGQVKSLPLSPRVGIFPFFASDL